MLAILVVANHLWLPTANKVGAHAVVAFYMISGYLMTKVLNEVYPNTASGFFRFVGNRFLRIYPLYWLTVIGTLAGLVLFPRSFEAVYSLIRIPDSLPVLFSNISLVNLISSPIIVIPPAWSLTVEFFFYLAMGIILARSRFVVLVWLLVSLAITIYLILTNATFGERYSTLYASSLFFSIGAAVYFCLPLLRRYAMAPIPLAVLFGVFAIWPLLVRWLGGDIHGLGYYGAAGLFIPVLVSVVARPMQGRAARIDKWLGELAYPVFLLHFFSAGIVGAVLGGRLQHLSFSYLIVCTALTLLLSVVTTTTLDPAVNSLRDMLRGRPRPGPEPVAIAASGMPPEKSLERT